LAPMVLTAAAALTWMTACALGHAALRTAPSTPRSVRVWMVAPSEQPPPRPSPLAALAATESPATLSMPETALASTGACAAAPTESERRRSVVIGATAALGAIATYCYQRANPLNPVQLLDLMAQRSPKLPAALESGMPTIVEFYAPWCVSCRESAPAMLRFEKLFGERVNFVVLNGEDPANAQLVRLFGVDGIPHLAFIGGNRKLQGTLIGAIPEAIVEQSLSALVEGRPLPYQNVGQG